MPLALGASALALIGQGTFLLLGNRSIVMHGASEAIWAVAPFFPLAVPLAFSLFRESPGPTQPYEALLFELTQLIGLLFLAGLLSISVRHARGYMVVGVDQEMLRQTLLGVLTDLHLEHEIKKSLGRRWVHGSDWVAIELTTLSAELEFTAPPRRGTGRFWLSGQKHAGLLSEIADGVRTRFEAEPARSQKVRPLLCVLAGLILGGTAVALVVLR